MSTPTDTAVEHPVVAARYTQTIKRIGRYDVQVECDCGWRGAVRTIRQIGGWNIAKRDAKEHEWAHANAAGWFDHTKGWITNPDHQQNH